MGRCAYTSARTRSRRRAGEKRFYRNMDVNKKKKEMKSCVASWTFTVDIALFMFFFCDLDDSPSNCRSIIRMVCLRIAKYAQHKLHYKRTNDKMPFTVARTQETRRATKIELADQFECTNKSALVNYSIGGNDCWVSTQCVWPVHVCARCSVSHTVPCRSTGEEMASQRWQRGKLWQSVSFININ